MTEQDGTEPDIHSIQGHKEKVPMERADNFRACHERNHLCCSSTNEDHVKAKILKDFYVNDVLSVDNSLEAGK